MVLMAVVVVMFDVCGSGRGGDGSDAGGDAKCWTIIVVNMETITICQRPNIAFIV